MAGEAVWLSRCGGYAPEELLRQMEEAFTALGIWEEIRPGMAVVIKPNLVISSKPDAAIATHPALVAAVGKCVQKAGGEVVIAESPGGPYTPATMKAIFRGCGYTDMARTVASPCTQSAKAGRFPCRGQCAAASFPWRNPSSPGITSSTCAS